MTQTTSQAGGQKRLEIKVLEELKTPGKIFFLAFSIFKKFPLVAFHLQGQKCVSYFFPPLIEYWTSFLYSGLLIGNLVSVCSYVSLCQITYSQVLRKRV